MSRKLPVLLLPLFLLFFASTANAQATTTASAPTANIPAVSVITNAPTATDAATKLRLQMQLLEEQRRAAITKVKEDARALAQAKRDEFKTKLQTIKDQKKQALVERIDAKIAEVNKNQTTRFLEVLVNLQGFLDKIKQSTTSATVVADITAAQTAIDTAKTAVDTQAAKNYTAAITDETTLKLNVGATVSQFRLDLVAVYRLVIDAKQAVQKLNIDKSTIKKEATSSVEL